MSTLRETPGNKTIRLGLESKINDFYVADDMAHVNKYRCIPSQQSKG